MAKAYGGGGKAEGWMEAQMVAAVRAVAARVAGGEGGGCDSGGGVGGHESGGAGADGHVGDDHQELGLGDQRRTVCSARTCRRKKGSVRARG